MCKKHMFQLSETLSSIFSSRRYTKPLTPEFQAAADKLAKQQAELDAHMRSRKLDQARAHVQSVRPSTPNNENSCGTTSTHHNMRGHERPQRHVREPAGQLHAVTCSTAYKALHAAALQERLLVCIAATQGATGVLTST